MNSVPELTLDDLAPVRLAAAGDRPELAWAEGLDLMLPKTLVDGLLRPVSGGYAVAPDPDGTDGAPLAPLAEALRLVCAFTETPPASTRLPIPYQMVPVFLRDRIAKHIGRKNRRLQHVWARFPLFPLDLSADFAADLCGLPNPLRGGPCPVVLTHDLDTPEGLENLVRLFLPLEERVGARSANYIPARAWDVDLALLDEVAARGHEVGVHGYDHNNRTPYCPQDERDQRLGAARWLVERYGAKGYRAPSLVRTRALLASLPGLLGPGCYDSTIPSSGGPFPAHNNGCATARPFRIGPVTELPLSMPRDANLWFQGYPALEILRIWKDCAARIAASGGAVVLLTHCERRFSGREPLWGAYASFLEWLAADARFAFSTPAAVLETWNGGAA